jgi:hypothetical protein
MSALDVVKGGFAAAESKDWKKFEGYLADDFVFSGATPQPVGKKEFVGLQMALQAAMPDWNFNASGFKESGDKVTVDMRITGTQTQELSLPMPGFPKVPATNKKVSLPSQPGTYTVKGDKLVSLEVKEVQGGGLPGILAQLGVKMPS